MAMDEKARAVAGAKALIDGLDARLEEIGAEAVRLEAEFSKLEKSVRVILKRMTALRKEQQELEALKRRYEGRPAKADANGARDERPGTTAAILNLMLGAPNRQMFVEELVERIEAGIKSGAVRTDTTDPRKLASTVVGNLVRQGRLVRQIHRDGEVVILAENGRKAAKDAPAQP